MKFITLRCGPGLVFGDMTLEGQPAVPPALPAVHPHHRRRTMYNGIKTSGNAEPNLVHDAFIIADNTWLLLKYFPGSNHRVSALDTVHKTPRSHQIAGYHQWPGNPSFPRRKGHASSGTFCYLLPPAQQSIFTVHDASTISTALCSHMEVADYSIIVLVEGTLPWSLFFIGAHLTARVLDGLLTQNFARRHEPADEHD